MPCSFVCRGYGACESFGTTTLAGGKVRDAAGPWEAVLLGLQVVPPAGIEPATHGF
jgi:hypothetical protein